LFEGSLLGAAGLRGEKALARVGERAAVIDQLRLDVVALNGLQGDGERAFTHHVEQGARPAAPHP
jgi:hypothetical protein